MTEIIIRDDLIHLRNDRISYVMGKLQGGIMTHLYFGRRVQDYHAATMLRRHRLAEDASFSMQNCALNHVPQEYPSNGLGDMREGALIVRGQDGTASCDLRFVSAEASEGKYSLPGLPAASERSA